MKIARIFGLLAPALLFGRQSPADRPDTVIRTTTRLVQVLVVAEDSQGRPVTDLRKEDFQLQDNRKFQPIVSFATEGSTLPASETGVSASQSEEEEAARNDYAMILLDWLNPRYADRLFVRDQVNKLLRNFQPRQRVALYLLGHEPRLLHDFTSDGGDLLQALADTPDDPEDPFDPAEPRVTDARHKTWATLTPEERMASFNVKVLDTIGVLQKVADGLARVPGRKSLIWVTNGFPIVLDARAVPGSRQDDVSYRQYTDPLLATLNRANVAVYTLDARGLQGDPIPPRLGLHPPPQHEPSYGDIGTLLEFSGRTGGTTFYNQNDLDEGMRLALEDTRISYTLGFAVPPGAGQGRHEIRVSTTRPGVKLRYRESYQLDEAPAPPRRHAAF
jgi:VWFA-related protein